MILPVENISVNPYDSCMMILIVCSNSQIASNLPWAKRNGNDVGGVTCICITRKYFPRCHNHWHSFILFRLRHSHLKSIFRLSSLVSVACVLNQHKAAALPSPFVSSDVSYEPN